jgi:hypothetical protein
MTPFELARLVHQQNSNASKGQDEWQVFLHWKCRHLTQSHYATNFECLSKEPENHQGHFVISQLTLPVPTQGL